MLLTRMVLEATTITCSLEDGRQTQPGNNSISPVKKKKKLPSIGSILTKPLTRMWPAMGCADAWVDGHQHGL
jgi:hypothetical protein